MKVYLAGRMGGLTHEEMNAWRIEASKKLIQHDIKSINPVDFYNFELDLEEISDKEIMDFDLTAVRNSDLVLVNLNDPNTIGTAIEMYECKRLNIPVVTYVDDDKYDNIHPWMKECVTKWCQDLDIAVDYIVSFYKLIFE